MTSLTTSWTRTAWTLSIIINYALYSKISDWWRMKKTGTTQGWLRFFFQDHIYILQSFSGIVLVLVLASFHPVVHTPTLTPFTPSTSHPPPSFTRRPRLPESGIIPLEIILLWTSVQSLFYICGVFRKQRSKILRFIVFWISGGTFAKDFQFRV